MNESKNRKIPPRSLLILFSYKEGNENPFGFESSKSSNLPFCFCLTHLFPFTIYEKWGLYEPFNLYEK